jgi:hypothetical protein
MSHHSREAQKQAITDWLAKTRKGSKAASLSVHVPRNSNFDTAVSQPFSSGPNHSNPNATRYEMFSNPQNHKDAAASILTYVANATNFHPAGQTAAQTAQAWPAYISHLESFPGFSLQLADTTDAKEAQINVTAMIQDIKAAYNDVVDPDAANLEASIINMANSALVHVNVDDTNTGFIQSQVWTSTGTGSQVIVTIFYTTLHITRDINGKTTMENQEYTVNRVKLQVLSQVLVDDAQQLGAAIEKNSVDDWLAALSSPTSAAAARTLCFLKPKA